MYSTYLKTNSGFSSISIYSISFESLFADEILQERERNNIHSTKRFQIKDFKKRINNYAYIDSGAIKSTRSADPLHTNVELFVYLIRAISLGDLRFT
jgi:hypothetical protein